VTRYVRFETSSGSRYGIVDGDSITEMEGDLFNGVPSMSVHHRMDAVKLLAPCEPSKIMAVGLNYKSHLGNRPQPTHPEMFYKPVSALQNPGGPIVIPRDATDLHYEGELVIVIGKRVRNAGRDEAAAAIFGVTCGNDVSERNWQHGQGKDLQWWRAKGCDTFAPLGPVIVAGVDYGNLQLQTRLNGEVVQKQTTADLIFDCPAIVSWVSGWVTLMPGDVIYTGTPGSTRALKPGDTVEIEIENIGVLRNTVESSQSA
jgi:2-keto-4-pentenoate hydratase/2-oxohepta-3-ene-1,7-dioic acid hydratase in catechol pathway